MKLGIIRCMQTEDYCPGTADFKAARLHMGAFAQVEEEIEIVAEAAQAKKQCCGPESW